LPNLNPNICAISLDIVRMVDPGCPNDILPAVGLGRGVGAQSPRSDVTVERKEGFADVRRGGEGSRLLEKKASSLVCTFSRIFVKGKTSLGAIAGVRDVVLRPFEDKAGGITGIGRDGARVVREEGVVNEREIEVVSVGASGWTSLVAVEHKCQ
jgi:hypothetical protein